MEKVLSQVEMGDLLQRIEATGFLKLDGNGALLENDPIYEINGTLEFGHGGPETRITVRDKTVTIHSGLWDYLVQPVKQTAQIIWDYQPLEIQRYLPDRLWLWIWDVTGFSLEFSFATPIPPGAEWPAELPPLAVLRESHAYEYAILEEAEVSFVQDLFPQYPISRMFRQNNRDYYVVACPLLP